jgi:hypothetical protein
MVLKLPGYQLAPKFAQLARSGIMYIAQYIYTRGVCVFSGGMSSTQWRSDRDERRVLQRLLRGKFLWPTEESYWTAQERPARTFVISPSGEARADPERGCTITARTFTILLGDRARDPRQRVHLVKVGVAGREVADQSIIRVRRCAPSFSPHRFFSTASKPR